MEWPMGDIRMTIDMKLTAVYLKVSEGYIGFVEELPGANTQGQTLEEAKLNLEEAITLVLQANRTLTEESLQGQDVIRETISIFAA
jgi:predicted RNase H-like HicB family nuclease